MAWNDRIWGDGVSGQDRERMNQLSKKIFGFPAAPEELPVAGDWEDLVQRAGFKIILSERITRRLTAPSPKLNLNGKLSRLRTFVTRPQSLQQSIRDKLIHLRYKGEWDKMENWIFVARRV